jgi:hypothetical protein
MESGMNSSPEGVEPSQDSILIAFPFLRFSFADFQFTLNPCLPQASFQDSNINFY